MSPSLRYVLACLIAFAPSGGCTTDEAIDGKPCDLSAPREKQCITGYECRCEPEGCFCRAVGSPAHASSLSVPVLDEAQVSGADPALDSAAFLRRLFDHRICFGSPAP